MCQTATYLVTPPGLTPALVLLGLLTKMAWNKFVGTLYGIVATIRHGHQQLHNSHTNMECCINILLQLYQPVWIIIKTWWLINQFILTLEFITLLFSIIEIIQFGCQIFHPLIHHSEFEIFKIFQQISSNTVELFWLIHPYWAPC